MLKGFPSSNRINPGKFAEAVVPNTILNNKNTIALIGFTSKGPINTPTLIRDSQQLRTMFGLPHPDQRESNLLYAAEQCLLIGADLLIYRAAKNAKIATTLIPGADNLVKTHSTWPEPYVFHSNQFFRWKLNSTVSNKTLVVLATDEKGISALQLADELNDQLTVKDGIQFYVHKDKYLGVRTTLISKNKLELVSIQDAMYGPWGVTGFGVQMSPAEKIGESKTGLYDLGMYDGLSIDVVVTGSTNRIIDNIIQTISLKGLEGKINKISDIVDYINNNELPLLSGGWRAFAAGNALGFRTKHAGCDASILVKFSRASSDIFGFDSKPALGKSPKDEAIFFGSKNSSDNASLTIQADSPGVDGNNTRVIITNDNDVDTFTIDVFNNGRQVESWGQLTKNKNSRLYVESFINLVSSWIRIIDNPNNSTPPKNGSYLLDDERIAGAVKGCDGIPSDLFAQDEILAGDTTSKTGVYSLVDFGVDMVAVPGHSSDVVINALLEVCNKQGMRCFAIIDTPMNLSLADAAAWSKSFQSDFGAVFWPWVQIRDVYNRRNVWVPPSGSVMATIARSDSLSAPWHAATGHTRGVVPGVLDVFQHPTNGELTKMNESVVNPITHYAGTDSFAVSSQKTLQAGNINTRRTLFYIEKIISRAIDTLTGYDLSEDELREKISQVCEHVLEQVKNGRGIYKYSIKFGSETNVIGVDKKEELQARIGVQPRESSEVYYIKLPYRIG